MSQIRPIPDYLIDPPKQIPKDADTKSMMELSDDAFWRTVDAVQEELERSYNPELIIFAKIDQSLVCNFSRLREIPPEIQEERVLYITRNGGVKSCRTRTLMNIIDAASHRIEFYKPSHTILKMLYTALCNNIKLIDIMKTYEHDQTQLLHVRDVFVDWEKLKKDYSSVSRPEETQ